jgi:glutathione S-transferase
LEVFVSHPYRFIAADLSMFSGKVRPVLRRKGLHFVEELATLERWEERARLTGNQMIPTVVTPAGEALQDSSLIFDALEERHPEIPLLPANATLDALCRLFELVHDELLPVLAIYYRWVHPDAIPQGTARIQAMVGGIEEGLTGAKGMQAAVPFIGMNEMTIPEVERIYRELLAVLDAHLAVHRFLLGGEPTLADTSLVGGIYAHLYLDWVPHKIMWETAPHVCRWVQQTQMADPSISGELFDPSALPETFDQLLRHLARDAASWLLDTVAAVDRELAHAKPDTSVPRALGTHDTALRSVPTRRATTPITLFKFQRLRDAYLALLEDGSLAGDVFAETGWGRLLGYEPRHRVEFRDHRLVLQA